MDLLRLKKELISELSSNTPHIWINRERHLVDEEVGGVLGVPLLHR